MPQTTMQRIIFTILMAGVMVYAMICYNIAIDMGAMTNEIFAIALHELVFMLPIAFILEFFIYEKLAIKMTFNLINPRESKPLAITLTISIMIVILMCPSMSFVATLLFDNPHSTEIIAVWLQKTVVNFPMALGFQIFIAGPLVRTIFAKSLMRNKSIVAA